MLRGEHQAAHAQQRLPHLPPHATFTHVVVVELQLFRDSCSMQEMHSSARHARRPVTPHRAGHCSFGSVQAMCRKAAYHYTSTGTCAWQLCITAEQQARLLSRCCVVLQFQDGVSIMVYAMQAASRTGTSTFRLTPLSRPAHICRVSCLLASASAAISSAAGCTACQPDSRILQHSRWCVLSATQQHPPCCSSA